MKKPVSEIKGLFFKGEYRRLFEQTVDAKSWKKKGEPDLSYVIGALAFAGRMEEAQLLSVTVFELKDLSSHIRTRFFLGLGYTRLSEYSRALKFFAENYRLVRKKRLSGENIFYIYQGISFYRFYCGRFAAAKRASDIAFEAAFEADYLYGKALATDIRSHILIGLGETSSGFELRQRAIQLLKLLGHKSLIMAFQITTMTDRARLGFTPQQSLADLKNAMSTLKPEDNYSRANFLLELARQLTLRGRVQEAGSILDQASEVIYAFQNRRQEATLNLRYGYLSYCSGDYSRGLSAIRSAKRTLHPEVDRVLESERLGLELKLVRALKMDAQAEKLELALKPKPGQDCSFIHRRIVSRTDGEFNLVRKGMDPLGDLIDLAKTNPQEAIDPLLEAGYLQIFYDLLQLDRQMSVLYVDLRPGLVLAFERGEVSALDGLTALLRKVLKALSQNVTSKEEIFLKAWGFKYDSLRHDTVIYAAINSIRKLLGTKANWLETVENGYRLNPSVRIIYHKGNEPLIAGSVQQEPPSLAELSLNYRQIEILAYVSKNKFIDVQQCKKLFDVSDITASRDLSSLTSLGHVLRIGRGRATKYSRRQIQE